MVLVALLIVVGSTGAPLAQVLDAAADSLVLENRLLRVQVVAAGGRIASLVDKPTGVDLVALWRGEGEIGGLLDDRLRFTGARYRAERSAGHGEQVLRLTAADDAGLRLVKCLVLRDDERVLRLRYSLANGSQEPVRLWVRNFLMPGARPLGDRHLYWVPQPQGQWRGPFAAEYFGDLPEPWAALQDTVAAHGVLVVVPGVERFYFWQGSRASPTFEWLFPQIPAGHRLEAELALTVTGEREPDWSRLAAALLPSLAPLTTAALQDWTDARAAFEPTAAEQAQGFWLSTGRREGKGRCPEVLEVDLPLEGSRATYVGINPLASAAGDSAAASVHGALAEHVALAWERHLDNAIVLEPAGDAAGPCLEAGVEQRLWLLLDAGRSGAGTWDGELAVRVGAHHQRVPLRLRVWPVAVPDRRPFEVRGYATVVDFFGNYAPDPASLQRGEALLGAYAAMGGSVLDWTLAWGSALPFIRLADSGEPLSTVAAWPPGRLDLDHPPPLDFSHFDPWLAAARRHGVTRVEAYMDLEAAERWRWPCLGPEPLDSGAAERVAAWIYGELRRYCEEHGCRGFFCKISDEISPEHVPAYVRTATLARRAGWRPFTTITGLLARSAENLEELDPHCDQWQVGLPLKDDFRAWQGADPADEVWFYGGGTRPYTTPYEDAFVYPLLAAAERAQGYGWWAFHWWQATEKIVWYDADSGTVRRGPAYLGLRDGWEDARLFAWVVDDLGAVSPAAAVGGPGALLELGTDAYEVYRWTTIVNLSSPVAINNVRRALLEAAARPR